MLKLINDWLERCRKDFVWIKFQHFGQLQVFSKGLAPRILVMLDGVRLRLSSRSAQEAWLLWRRSHWIKVFDYLKLNRSGL